MSLVSPQHGSSYAWEGLLSRWRFSYIPYMCVFFLPVACPFCISKFPLGSLSPVYLASWDTVLSCVYICICVHNTLIYVATHICMPVLVFIYSYVYRRHVQQKQKNYVKIKHNCPNRHIDKCKWLNSLKKNLDLITDQKSALSYLQETHMQHNDWEKLWIKVGEGYVKQRQIKRRQRKGRFRPKAWNETEDYLKVLK